MTENKEKLKPCPFCGEQAEQPFKNMDMFTCTSCIHYSESTKVIAVTGRNWKLGYCWKEIDSLKAKLKIAEEALESMLSSHFNLYKVCFGENQDPNVDIPRKECIEALTKIREGRKEL